jgi:uncharacterized protein YecT (DUF1311 family)
MYHADMDRRVTLFCFDLVLIAAPLQGQASVQRRESDWKRVCLQAAAAPLAQPSPARAETGSDLQHCDSTALYYGFDQPADWNAARSCAYYQRSHPRQSPGDPFYGPGVLTMLYANARGVPRDYELAIRFACENSWAADAEMELRIGHLEQLRDARAQVASFDLCDDGTSGLMEGACESVRQRLSDVKRRQELDRIAAGWPPRVKEAFQSLRAAEDAFVAARTGKEVDLSGTGRAAFSLEEEGRLRDQFLINLRRFARGDVPHASPADYQSADHSLNEAYQHLRQAPESFWQGTIKPAGIRDTEVAWLKLREEWVEFARLAYPRLSADTVRTQITRLRLHQLIAMRKA